MNPFRATDLCQALKYIVSKLALTLSFPMFPFDPPEIIRKPKVFLYFQGDQKGKLGTKGLKTQD